MTTLRIPRQFRGPPESGNGGYTCGLLARSLGGTVEVTLRAPPPLDEPLELVEGERLELKQGPTTIASAEAHGLELDTPPAISFEEATDCATRYAGHERHFFPECFTCGPGRTEDDGLRIFSGAVEGAEGRVAAPWIPHDAMADPSGRIPTEIVWAALDCPGYFAAALGEPAVLGRMTAGPVAPVEAGEHLVVIGWSIGRSGRKRTAGTALYDETGTLRGCALQTWISLAR